MHDMVFGAARRSANVFKHVVRDPRLIPLATAKLAGRAIDPWFRTRTDAYRERAVPVDVGVKQAFGPSAADRILEHMNDPALISIEEQMTKRVGLRGGSELGGAAFTTLYYGIVRERRPSVVIETGVASGYSSGAILAALAQNGHGHLWSVDVAPLSQDSDSLVGAAVPDDLRDRWTLLRGPDRHELRRLLPGLGEIDLGFYDSDKTYLGMAGTLDLLWSYVGPSGALVVDDVQTQDAFMRFCGDRSIPLVSFLKPNRGGEAGAYFVGIASKRRTPSISDP